MELVGRSREIADIERAVTAAREGEMRALAVVGEAGIGKSVLLDAAAAAAERTGMLVLRGRAAEHEREVPFGLAVDALDDHVAGLHPSRLAAVGPELGAVLPAAGEAGPPVAAGAAERFRHHRGLRSLLELLGRERPVALLLDDLHWADEASAELVLHLLRRPPRVGFLLAVAMRPGPVAERVRDAGRRGEAWLELRPGPLDRETALALLPAGLDPDRRERLLGTAAGNPLFLEQLARHGSGAEVPETVAAAVRGELTPLSDAARELAEGAAIAGDPFDLDVAVAAAGTASGAAVDELVAAGLVHGEGGRRFRFRHPLVHRAIADSVPPGRRLDAHERAAAALAAAGAAPALRAHHVAEFARPGDEEAVALLLQAAGDAERTAPRTAAGWYTAALALLPHDEAERRAEIVGPMAAALAAAGDLAGSRAAIEEGIGMLGPEQAEQRAALTSVAATVEVLLGQFGAAESRLVAGLEDAPAAQRPRLLLQRGGVAFFTGDVGEVLEWARRAEQELGDDGPPSLRAAASAQRGFGLALRGEGGGDLLLAAAEILEESDESEPAQRGEAFWTVGGNLGQIERFAAAATVLERGLRLARETHQEHLLGHLHVLLAMSQLPLLRLDDALEHATTAEEIARLQTRAFDLGFALAVKARVLSARGDAVGAERAAFESDELVGEPVAPVSRSILAHNAVVRLADDPERLLAELERIAGRDLDGLNPLARAAIAVAATRAALALDRLDDGERLAGAAAGAVRDGEPPVSALRARRAEAELSLARGEAAAAAEGAEGAAAEAAAIGVRQEELEAGFLRARALLADDRRDAGLEALQAIAAAAAETGALGLHDAAARELRRAGARVSSRARRGGENGELTAREREIAELVAGGRSNKQVAAALFVSEKTVERHLSAIYARLGIRSRVELPRALDEARGSD